MEVKELLPLVASGKVVIPANKNHKSLDPEGIGSMLKTKINVNLGISKDCKDYDVEMEKVMSAVKMGGEAIMVYQVMETHSHFVKNLQVNVLQ